LYEAKVLSIREAQAYGCQGRDGYLINGNRLTEVMDEAIREGQEIDHATGANRRLEASIP
jgi:hypothetical protein